MTTPFNFYMYAHKHACKCLCVFANNFGVHKPIFDNSFMLEKERFIKDLLKIFMYLLFLGISFPKMKKYILINYNKIDLLNTIITINYFFNFNQPGFARIYEGLSNKLNKNVIA